MQIRVIVVEDETAIQRGIVSLIRQMQLPLEVVGSYFSGTAALQHLQEARPDIVITDVQMPGMSGLELIDQIRRQDSAVEFLILSGYSDFAYVKDALKMNVHNYLLKPPRITELRESLEHLCTRIRQRRHEQTGQALQQLVFQRRQPERMLPAWEEEIYSVLSCGLGSYQDSGMLWSTVAVQTVLLDSGVDGEKFWVLDNYGTSMKQIVFQGAVDTAALARRLAAYTDTFAPQSTLVVGQQSQPWTALPEICATQRHWLQRLTMFGQTQILTQSQCERKTHLRYFTYTERDLLRKTCLLSGADAMLTQLKTLAAKWETRQAPQIAYVEAARFAAMEIIRSCECEEVPELEEAVVEQLDILAGQASSPAAFVQQAVQCLTLAARGGCGRERQVSEVVDQLEQMILEDYCGEIDFAAFAGQHGYHPGYLMGKYSKQKGISPKKQVIQLRMEKAKELLSGTDLQIKAIAQLTGYGDLTYFSRIFKEYTGVSASVYRETHGPNGG